jgi:hypothetical protein
MPPWSYTNPMWRDAMVEIQAMLEGEPGEDAEAIRAEAKERVTTFEKWLTGELPAPSDEERKTTVKVVTALYKRTRELLSQRAAASKPPESPREPSPSHSGQ